jgi:hypothetical protein
MIGEAIEGKRGSGVRRQAIVHHDPPALPNHLQAVEHIPQCRPERVEAVDEAHVDRT